MKCVHNLLQQLITQIDTRLINQKKKLKYFIKL